MSSDSMPENRPEFFRELWANSRNWDEVFRNLTAFSRKLVRNLSKIRQKFVRNRPEFLTKSDEFLTKLVRNSSETNFWQNVRNSNPLFYRVLISDILSEINFWRDSSEIRQKFCQKFRQKFVRNCQKLSEIKLEIGATSWSEIPPQLCHSKYLSFFVSPRGTGEPECVSTCLAFPELVSLSEA